MFLKTGMSMTSGILLLSVDFVSYNYLLLGKKTRTPERIPCTTVSDRYVLWPQGLKILNKLFLVNVHCSDMDMFFHISTLKNA